MSDRSRLGLLADQCVQCGLCLPACPTYALDRQEGASPRGRIALIAALAADPGAAGPGLDRHLAQCLGCRRCESVCPAKVRYGELIAGARALPELRRRRSLASRLLSWWLAGPRRRRWLLRARPLLPLLAPWWRTGRSVTAQRLRLLATLPAPDSVSIDPAAAPSPARTALLPGCLAAPYEAALRAHARRLLAAVGEELSELDADLCCGSLARYAGDARAAERAEQGLLAQVRAAGLTTVLVTASGCLPRSREVLATAGVQVRSLHLHLAERSALLTRAIEATGVVGTRRRVAIHQPCSQPLSGSEEHAAVRKLLGCVPGLDLVDLPACDRCCGAAGRHFLDHPAHVQRLRARVLDDIERIRPSVIVSPNIGCRLFLRAGLDDVGPTLDIVHPIELLAEALPE